MSGYMNDEVIWVLKLVRLPEVIKELNLRRGSEKDRLIN